MPLAVMLNPVVGTGTVANFFVVGTMVGAVHLRADLFRGGARPDGQPIRRRPDRADGRHGDRRTDRRAHHGVDGALQASGRSSAWRSRWSAWPSWRGAPASLPLWEMEVLLAVTGIGMGTIFPVTTVSIQNAVAAAPARHGNGDLQLLPLARQRRPGRRLRRDLPERARHRRHGRSARLQALVREARAERHADRARLPHDLRRRVAHAGARPRFSCSWKNGR